jgi:hypothetical protein
MISDYGITINEICATCKNKKIGKDYRKCKFNGKVVESDYRCNRYEPLPWLQFIGKGGGKVKKRSELMKKLEELCGTENEYTIAQPYVKMKKILLGE